MVLPNSDHRVGNVLTENMRRFNHSRCLPSVRLCASGTACALSEFPRSNPPNANHYADASRTCGFWFGLYVRTASKRFRLIRWEKPDLELLLNGILPPSVQWSW